MRVDEAELRRRNGLARDDGLGVVSGRALHEPGVPVVVALERGRLDVAAAVRRDDRRRVPVGAEVRDGDHAGGVAEALAPDGVDDREAVGVTGGGVPRDLVRVRVLVDIGRAERVAVDVGRDLAEDVVDVALEALEAGLAVVDGAVGRGLVEVDLGAKGRVGQRVGLRRNGDDAVALHRDGEVDAVDLVAVREDGHEVVTVGEVDGARGEVGARALPVDRRRAGALVDRRPVAVGRVARVVRRAAGAGLRRAERLGLAAVVDVDQVAEAGDGVALGDRGGLVVRLGAGAHHLDRDRARRGGVRRHGHEDRRRHDGAEGQREGADGCQPPTPDGDRPSSMQPAARPQASPVRAVRALTPESREHADDLDAVVSAHDSPSYSPGAPSLTPTADNLR